MTSAATIAKKRGKREARNAPKQARPAPILDLNPPRFDWHDNPETLEWARILPRRRNPYNGHNDHFDGRNYYTIFAYCATCPRPFVATGDHKGGYFICPSTELGEKEYD